jgi:hypothetical protein
MATEAISSNEGLFKKRIEILNGAKLKEVGRVNNAIRVQDSIRKKIKNWDGSIEVRKSRT